MPLIHWEPFKDLEELFWDLAVDVYEENNTIVVKMNIPGIDPDKIDIEVEDNHLHISGERKEEHEIKDKKYHRKEIRCGSFERVIALPCAVSSEDARAEFSDGVLTIALPRVSEEKKVNKIKVSKK